MTDPNSILVTACARSGTTHTAQFLSTMLDDHVRRERHDLRPVVGHEMDGIVGKVCWRELLQGNPRGYRMCIHQVRHPIPCIQSMHTIKEDSWAVIASCIADVRMEDRTILRAMNYWFHGNVMGMCLANNVIAVESLSEMDVIKGFCKAILPEGAKVRSKVINELYNFPKNINHRDSPDLVTRELLHASDARLFDMICGLAHKFGYRV